MTIHPRSRILTDLYLLPAARGVTAPVGKAQNLRFKRAGIGSVARRVNRHPETAVDRDEYL
jgi:hypothetical protein